MKTIVRILMTAAAVMMFANFASAQDDTQHLCEQVAPFSHTYTADQLATSNTTIQWVATGGTIAGDDTANSVDVEWPAGPGTYTLTLTETHTIGTCVTVYELEVIVHETPTATFIADASTSCAGEPGSFFLGITSDTDWTLTYTIDGGAPLTLTGTGDTSHEFTPTVADLDTYLITGITTDVAVGGCAGTIGAEPQHVITPITLTPVILY